MAVIASDQITLTDLTDVSASTTYYLAQTSTLTAPSKPTVKSPTGWTTTEPTVDTSKSLYVSTRTDWSNGEFTWSDVSLSSSYEAAKAAYNKAVAAANAAAATDQHLTQQMASVSGTYSTKTELSTVASTAYAASYPDLTPFFSHSLTDTAYWKDIYTACITQLTDGWAHFAYDNSAGTSFKLINAFVSPQPFVVGGKVYTALAEIRNVTGVTSSSLAVLSRDGDITQLVWDTNQVVNPIKDGTYYFPQQTPNANLIEASTLTSGAQSTSMTNCLRVLRGNDATLTWSSDGCCSPHARG